MQLPDHIANRVRELVARTATVGHHLENEAARFGAIPLMATLGALWMLRPDGSIWDVDSETDKPFQRLPEALHVTAIVAGVERYPWLAELLPLRPPDALDCDTCGGRGRIFTNPSDEEHFVYCPSCDALGWRITSS